MFAVFCPDCDEEMYPVGVASAGSDVLKTKVRYRCGGCGKEVAMRRL